MKRQNDRILKEELPRSVVAQYATGEEWRDSSRKNEKMELKWKQHPVVDVTSDGSKIQCCKEQYEMLGPWFGSGQTGDGKSEHWHFKNQWNKMNGNGLI